MPVQQRKAVALISGGLDSLLATKMMLEQGVHVEGINFFTGFCVEGHTHAIRNHHKNKPKRNNALWVAETLGIKLHIIDVIEEYKDIVINPKNGYGANLNPCLDCKGFMVGKAREWMEQNDFDFIITGEVMGQRPMSQTKNKMRVVVKESRVNDRLLRPLCAKHFEPTLPEREGWVNREKLGDISGRSRKQQMELANKWGIEDYAQPAGGCCFLTDEKYSNKLRDLWQARGTKQYEFDDIMLLKVGRHIRPVENFKLIISRDEGENNFLKGYRNRFISLRSESHAGPLALLDGEFLSDEQEQLAAQLVARFGKGKEADSVEIAIQRPNSDKKILSVKPIPAEQITNEWYV